MKKAATRDALGQAAVRLGKEHGFDAVTADAIAHEAGVSTRTFHNYFSNKEEAVLHHIEVSALEWFELLRSRPSTEPIWDSLRHIAINLVVDPGRDLGDTFAAARLVEANPALMARKLEMHQSLTRKLGEAIAERTGTDIETDLYPNLLQMAVGGAVTAALSIWMNDSTGQGPTPKALVEDAFDQLRAGLPEPQSRSAGSTPALSGRSAGSTPAPESPTQSPEHNRGA